MSPLTELKEKLASIISERTKLVVRPSDLVTPDNDFGDIALPAFRFTTEAKVPPAALAEQIAEKLVGSSPLIRQVKAVGPYVNIELNRSANAAVFIQVIAKGKYGNASNTHPAKLLLEYVSPNSNKPLHLGHLRNAALGWSLAQIFEANGFGVIKAKIVNDRGVHIMKPILAYERWGNNETPKSSGEKGDHLVAKYYVRFGEEVKKTPSLDEEAQQLLLKWEAGDPVVRQPWEQLRRWTLDGHHVTYERLGVRFDRTDFESDIYEEGKTIATNAVENGQARVRDDGAIVIDAGEKEEKVLLRADGTSVYITADLALAKKRLTEEKPERMIYVVGQEQDYQFKILFTVLQKLRIATPAQLAHISYHHVLLPEGRMKSREGTVVDTDNLLDELHALAAEEVRAHGPDLEAEEVKRRAEIIALAAAKFYMLRVRPNSDITFNPKESIAFTGHTGPYLLYTYARVQSIFRKAEAASATNQIPQTIADSEWRVLMALASFPNVIREAAEQYNPSLVADFAYALGKAINDLYEKEPVLKSEEPLRSWRLTLLKHATDTLKRSLELMGIATLDEM